MFAPIDRRFRPGRKDPDPAGAQSGHPLYPACPVYPELRREPRRVPAPGHYTKEFFKKMKNRLDFFLLCGILTIVERHGIPPCPASFMRARREVLQNLRATFLAARGNSSNSLQITSLADPHILTPVESHPYKNDRGATPLFVWRLPRLGRGALRLCDLRVRNAPLLQQRCKFAPLFSITCRMLLPQPLSFQAFALLPGGGRGGLKKTVKRVPTRENYCAIGLDPTRQYPTGEP